MIRWLLLVATLLVLPGCGAYLDAQRTAASTVAVTANAATKVLEETYRVELENALKASDDYAEYEQRRDVVVAKWEPLWTTHEALRTLHNHWADLVDSEDPSFFDVPKLKATYCKLRQIADDRHDVEMPNVGCTP